MARATIDDVKLVLPAGTELTDPQITAAITAANVLVNQAAACCCEGYPEDVLKQIEIYAAAHFCALSELALSRTSESDPCGGSASYGFKAGQGILGSPFGQMANTMSGGYLAEFDKQPVNLFSIGSI